MLDSVLLKAAMAQSELDLILLEIAQTEVEELSSEGSQTDVEVIPVSMWQTGAEALHSGIVLRNAMFVAAEENIHGLEDEAIEKGIHELEDEVAEKNTHGLTDESESAQPATKKTKRGKRSRVGQRNRERVKKEQNRQVTNLTKKRLGDQRPEWLQAILTTQHDVLVEAFAQNLVSPKRLHEMPFWKLPVDYLSMSLPYIFESLRYCHECKQVIPIINGEFRPLFCPTTMIWHRPQWHRNLPLLQKQDFANANDESSPAFDHPFWSLAVLAPVSLIDIDRHPVVCIDCEMVRVLLPNGQTDEAIITLSMVDVLTNAVLINTITIPDGEITDFRTDLTGFDEGLLAAAVRKGRVTKGLAGIQAHVLRFIDQETIIAGFALHNDLYALRLAHAKVFDLQWYLWKMGGYPSKVQSLKGVAKKRGMEIQNGQHGSLEDALATAQLCREILVPGLH